MPRSSTIHHWWNPRRRALARTYAVAFAVGLGVWVVTALIPAIIGTWRPASRFGSNWLFVAFGLSVVLAIYLAFRRRWALVLAVAVALLATCISVVTFIQMSVVAD